MKNGAVLKITTMHLPTTKSLVQCGIAASLVFALTDMVSGVIAAMTSSYSFTYNSISELLVPSAPPVARSVGLIGMATSDLLGMIFGFGGVLQSACKVGVTKRRFDTKQTTRPFFDLSFLGQLCVYQGGFLLGVAATCNLLSATLFPQDLRDSSEITFSGQMHLILLGVTVVSSLVAMWDLGRTIPQSRFGHFTILSVCAMVAGAILAPYFESQGCLGVAERFSAYSFIIWQGVLAWALLPCIPVRSKPG